MRATSSLHIAFPPADPSRPAVVVASDDGRPTYERMGFIALERWTARLRPASG